MRRFSVPTRWLVNLLLKQFFTQQRLVAIGIFSFTLVVFLLSHVHQVADSRYVTLVSESLVKHATFTLDAYKIPRYSPETRENYTSNGPIYQIEVADGHLYHNMPPGTAVLSAPYVTLLNLFGFSAANADGTYNDKRDTGIQASLAALLMASLATVFFFTARLLLPTIWSAIIALGGALGTQVYSTASRALWSETWGIFLLGIVVYFLLAHDLRRRELSPLLLATFLAWSYFVRPTFAVHIAAITVYLLIFYRPLFLKYAITGAAWFGGFVIYSWIHFHRVVPSYYQPSRLQFQVFWTALAGNLISPARGVLIYVPVIVFVSYLLLRYRRFVAAGRLVWLALTIICGQLIAVSGFSHWWGGHSFGARMMTGAVPWFVLLGILGSAAMLQSRRQREPPASPLIWRIELASGALLLLISMFINTSGAASHATWLLNQRPLGIDEHPERLWDWRQPQFLAKYLPYPKPREFPLVSNTRIICGNPEAEKFLWYGWFQDENGNYWTDSSAAFVFALEKPENLLLRIHMAPFLVSGKITAQRLKIALNDRALSELTISDPTPQDYAISLPRELLRERNVLKFEMPDAQSPQKAGSGSDPRPRALNVQWIEFVSE